MWFTCANLALVENGKNLDFGKSLNQIVKIQMAKMPHNFRKKIGYSGHSVAPDANYSFSIFGPIITSLF